MDINTMLALHRSDYGYITNKGMQIVFTKPIQIGLWEVFRTFTIENNHLTVPRTEERRKKMEEKQRCGLKMHYISHTLSVKHTKIRNILNINIAILIYKL